MPLRCRSRGSRTRSTPPVLHRTLTRDGWRIAVHRYAPVRRAHGTPVVLCHGMGSNRFNLDGPGRTSLARYLVAHGYDVWLLELRGAGSSRRRLQLPPVPYAWSFEDYAQHDAPAALRLVRRESGRPRVLWVGHSLGGMVAYALLMTPAGDSVAGAVTIASPAMTDVGHETLDFWVGLRRFLRYAPARIPSGLLARLGAPLAGPIAALLREPLRDWGFHDDNLDLEVVRFMMTRGLEDLPRSLLVEFARWYEARRMSDRYDLFAFSDHLERIATPMLVIAGSRDGLTPAADIRHVYEQIGSKDKDLFVAGKEAGLGHEYSHVDLVLGRHAPDEVFPRIGAWLDAHRAACAMPVGH